MVDCVNHDCRESIVIVNSCVLIQDGFQPRPQGFSLKKWVGRHTRPTHFLREKPWGRGWMVYSLGESSHLFLILGYMHDLQLLVLWLFQLDASSLRRTDTIFSAS